MTAPLRILIVDDHLTFGEFFARALDVEPDVECVGAATSADEALTKIELLQPDVVVMDVRLGQDDGIELTRRLTASRPALRILILTAHPEDDLIRRAAKAGACGVLPKDGSSDEVLTALRSARVGSFSVHPRLMNLLVRVPQQRQGPTALTRREEEVLRSMCAGHSVRHISRSLHISEHTARGHVRRVLSKLDAHTQLEAVATAHREGLLL